jgi:hypothetical protein
LTGLSGLKTQKAGRQKVGQFRYGAADYKVVRADRFGHANSDRPLSDQVRSTARHTLRGVLSPEFELIAWTDNTSPEQERPKGGVGSADRAVEVLGPFADPDGTLSEAEARLIVEKLARTLNHRLAVESDAPLIAHAIADLDRILELATQLSKALNSLDDVTRHIVRTGGGDIPGFIDFRASRKNRNDCFPDWIHGDLTKFTASLNGFVSHVDLTTAIFADRFASLGNNTNLYKRLIGTARTDLIQQGLLVFERFKPNQTKATVGGKLHQFLMRVFEYATGKRAEENAKFDTAFKRMVGGYRSYKRADAHLEILFQEQQALSQDPKGNMLRVEEIDAECVKVRSAMRASWRNFVPQLQY